MLGCQDATALLKLQAVEHLRACASIISAHETFSIDAYTAPICVQPTGRMGIRRSVSNLQSKSSRIGQAVVGSGMWSGAEAAARLRPGRSGALQDGDLLCVTIQHSRQALVGLPQRTRLALNSLIPATQGEQSVGSRTAWLEVLTLAALEKNSRVSRTRCIVLVAQLARQAHPPTVDSCCRYRSCACSVAQEGSDAPDTSLE